MKIGNCGLTFNLSAAHNSFAMQLAPVPEFLNYLIQSSAVRRKLISNSHRCGGENLPLNKFIELQFLQFFRKDFGCDVFQSTLNFVKTHRPIAQSNDQR